MANKPIAAKMRLRDPRLGEFLEELEPYPLTTMPVARSANTLRTATQLIYDLFRHIQDLEAEVERLRAATKPDCR